MGNHDSRGRAALASAVCLVRLFDPAASVASLALRLRPRNTPGGWRGQREARRGREIAAAASTGWSWAGSRPGRGHVPARRRGTHADRVRELAVVAGLC